MKLSRRALIAGIIVASSVIVLGTAALVGFKLKGDLDAQAAYDEAAASLSAALADQTGALSEFDQVAQGGMAAAQKASDLAKQADASLLADPATLTALQQAATTLTEAASAPAPAASETPPAIAKPSDRDALYAAAETLQSQAAAVKNDTTAVRNAIDPIAAALESTDAATSAVTASAHAFGSTVTPRSLASADTVAAFSAAVSTLESPVEGTDLGALVIAYRDAWYDTLTSDAIARADSGALEPTYMRGVLVVNKLYGLPSSFGDGLTAETSDAFATMKADAAAAGHNIYIASGFRSFASQTSIYNRYVSEEGVDGADRHSARPGHSEHQSGLTFDLNSITESFGRTDAGIWVAENAHLYGFIVRYPEGKEAITGYVWEPWHLRYVGVDVATELHSSGLTLEEWLGIESKYY
jgi:hypothetical protein